MNTKSVIFLVAVPVLFTNFSLAMAELITHSYEGIIVSTGGYGYEVPSFLIGDPFKVTYTFEANTANSGDGGPVANYVGAVKKLSFQVGSYSGYADSGASIQIGNNYSYNGKIYDYYGLSIQGYQENLLHGPTLKGWKLQSFAIQFHDLTHTAFSANSLPKTIINPLKFFEPNYTYMQLGFRGPNSENSAIVAQFIPLNPSQFTYPIGGIKYSKCPIDSGTGYDKNNPSTAYTMVWSGKYSGSSNNRCEGSGGHPGVDIRGVSQLSKIVRSIGKGIVIEKNYSSGFGNYLIIQHDDRDYGKFYSVYGHLKSGSLDKIKKGPVDSGTAIGIMGNTGNSGGTHLHFQIDKELHRKGSVFIPYWPSRYPSPDDSKLSSKELQEAAGNVVKNTYDPIELIDILNNR